MPISRIKEGSGVACIVVSILSGRGFNSWRSQVYFLGISFMEFSLCCKDLLTALLRTVNRLLILSMEHIWYWIGFLVLKSRENVQELHCSIKIHLLMCISYF